MGRPGAAYGSAAPPTSRFQLPLVFVVVAVQTQQLPVAAIRWIVVVIVVLVVNGQLANVAARELPGAATADPWVDLQSIVPLSLRALVSAATSLRHDAIKSSRVTFFHGGNPSRLTKLIKLIVQVANDVLLVCRREFLV